MEVKKVRESHYNFKVKVISPGGQHEGTFDLKLKAQKEAVSTKGATKNSSKQDAKTAEADASFKKRMKRM